MSLFQTLLSQIEKQLETNNARKALFVAVLRDVVGVTIDPDSISVKDTVLYLRVSPTVRMAISLKKQKIIAAFKEKEIVISDVR